MLGCSQTQNCAHHAHRTVKHLIPCVMKNHHDFFKSVFATNLTKTEIWKCKLKKFDGEIHIVSSEDDQGRKKIKEAIQRVMLSRVVGFDTETAVTFPRGHSEHRHIGLVQIATDSDVILWRLRRRKKYIWNEFPAVLQKILGSNEIIKVGNGTYDDLKDLYESYNVTVSNMVDNQTIATDIGYNKIGLVPLAAQLFGWRISKAEQISNWELPELSNSQIEYASTDAWVSLIIYRELKKMSKLLQKGEPTKGTSSFDHILRKEAKLDADFLHSLDFFKERLHANNQHPTRQSTTVRQKPRINFNAVDYDISHIPLQLHCKESDNSNDLSRFPFIYQVIDRVAVT